MAGVITDASPSRILVVEDEPAIRDIVTTALRYQGHVVTEAEHGQKGLELASNNTFDVIVLDVMLPGLSGFEICRQLRDKGKLDPVLFLTARDEADDRVEGFVTGGDDYLTKPFSVDELVLRVAAILRRTGREAPSGRITVGDLLVNPAGKEVWKAGAPVDLSTTEFELLHYLVVNRGVVVSKAQILANVWDEDYDGSENVVELYIGYLRRKLNHNEAPLIHTKRGAGYVLREEIR